MEDGHDAPLTTAITLDGPSVRLRPITRADYEFLWICRTHPEILYLWMQERTLPGLEQYCQELDNTLAGAGRVLTTLLIETRDGEHPLGYLFAYDFSGYDHTTFVNIVIHPAYVQYGWASEAAILFFNYLFTFFDLRKISMEIFAFNQLVLDPILQMGARVEGRFTGQRYYQGAYHDIIRVAILREDWDMIAPRLLGALAEATPFPMGVSMAAPDSAPEVAPEPARNGHSSNGHRPQRKERRGASESPQRDDPLSE